MDKKTKYVIIAVLVVAILTFVSIKVYKLLEDYRWAKEVMETYSEISFTEPEGFTVEGKNLFELGPNLYRHDDNTACYISIGAYKKDDDKDTWFKRLIYIDLNSEVGEQQKITVDNKPAYLISVKENNSTTYYYGLESTHYYYLYRYTLYDYSKGDRNDYETNQCFVAREQLLSSIKLK